VDSPKRIKSFHNAYSCAYSCQPELHLRQLTYLHGGPDIAFSEDSVPAIERLDRTLHAIYAAAGIPMADVGRAFEISHSEPVDLAGVGDVPRNVEQTCALTWMCTSASAHAKQHPNDAAYQVIAQAIAAAAPA
jgi:hypothetical protein